MSNGASLTVQGALSAGSLTLQQLVFGGGSSLIITVNVDQGSALLVDSVTFVNGGIRFQGSMHDSTLVIRGSKITTSSSSSSDAYALYWDSSPITNSTLAISGSNITASSSSYSSSYAYAVLWDNYSPITNSTLAIRSSTITASSSPSNAYALYWSYYSSIINSTLAISSSTITASSSSSANAVLWDYYSLITNSTLTMSSSTITASSSSSNVYALSWWSYSPITNSTLAISSSTITSSSYSSSYAAYALYWFSDSPITNSTLAISSSTITASSSSYAYALYWDSYSPITNTTLAISYSSLRTSAYALYTHHASSGFGPSAVLVWRCNTATLIGNGANITNPFANLQGTPLLRILSCTSCGVALDCVLELVTYPASLLNVTYDLTHHRCRCVVSQVRGYSATHMESVTKSSSVSTRSATVSISPSFSSAFTNDSRSVALPFTTTLGSTSTRAMSIGTVPFSVFATHSQTGRQTETLSHTMSTQLLTHVESLTLSASSVTSSSDTLSMEATTTTSITTSHPLAAAHVSLTPPTTMGAYPPDVVTVPLAVQSITQATGTASVVLSGIAGGTSGPTAMRSLLILSLTRCGTNNDNDAAVDRTVNMLQWAVGPDDQSAMYRGAIAGNVCLLLGLLWLHGLAVGILYCCDCRQKLMAMCFRAHFPGIHAGFLSMFLPGVATGTAHLLMSPIASPAVDGYFIALGLASILCLFVALGYVVCTRITCLFVKCPAVVVQRAMEAYPRWHAVFGGTYMWVDNEDEHLSGYGALFEMYRRGGHREKFFLVETGFALALAVLSGMNVGCHTTSISGLVMTVLFLVGVVAYRPYLSRADGWYTIGTAVLQALSMLLTVIAVETNIVTQSSAAYLNSATTYMSTVKLMVDLCHAYYRTVRTTLFTNFLDSMAPALRRKMLHELFAESGDKQRMELLPVPATTGPAGLTVNFQRAKTEFAGLLDLPLDDATAELPGLEAPLNEIMIDDAAQLLMTDMPAPLTMDTMMVGEADLLMSEVQLLEAEQRRAELAAVLKASPIQHAALYIPI